METETPDKVWDAYLGARYEFRTPDGWQRLHVADETSRARRWLADHCRSYAFITAYNPASMALCEAENESRHEDLVRRLESRGWQCLPARGVDPARRWPDEPGFMVLDVAVDEIAELAKAFDQNAVVYGAGDEPPRLVTLRNGPGSARTDARVDRWPGNGETAGFEASHLGFAREEEWIFRDRSFAVGRGGALLVEGGNGSGKTTLLRVLAGLLEATAGRFHIPARSFAYLGHRLTLKDDLTARENLAFSNRLFNVSTAGIDDLLARVGLDGYRDTPAGRLSAGQRKRLALAALVPKPAAVWLLDEPYANLDAHGAAMLTRLITAHLADGGLALITSHGNLNPDLPRLERLSLDD